MPQRDRRCGSSSGRWGYRYPDHQTPWQAIHRSLVGQLETGAAIECAASYQRVAQTKGIPRAHH